MEQRTEKGIWKQLYQFPLVESENQIFTFSELLNIEKLPLSKPNKIMRVTFWNKEPIIHKLSHQTLFVHFWCIEYEDLLPQGHTKKQLQKLAVPVVIQKFMTNFFSNAN
jgi:A/G-specific adenine glycosylase